MKILPNSVCLLLNIYLSTTFQWFWSSFHSWFAPFKVFIMENIIVNDGSNNGLSHFLHMNCPLLILVFHPSYKHLNEVNEGKLHKGTKDESEADDDVDIQRCGARYLGFVLLSDKADSDDSYDNQCTSLESVKVI